MKNLLNYLGILLFVASIITGGVQATPLTGVWDGWIQFADGEETNNPNNVYVGPGYGGQSFDAEYLFYKFDYDNNILSLGLQTGFDVIDGVVPFSNKNYYAGDLALSFDGDSSNFEYAVDFGLYTEDYYGHTVDADTNGHDSPGDGVDDAGLYSVSTWNNHVYSGFTVSNPFAMDGGSQVASLLTNTAGSGTADGVTSYYRQVSFDISGLDLGDEYTVDAHWTMSCGNDNINGVFPVDEPSTLLLLGLGLISLGIIRLRKRTNA